MIEKFMKKHPETELTYERALLWWDEGDGCWVVYHRPYRKRGHIELCTPGLAADLAPALEALRIAGEG